MILQSIYLACLLFSAVMALINHRSLKSRRLFLFIPYLFLVFIQETILFYGSEIQIIASTAVVYNIYKPVTTLFFAVLYYRIPLNAPVRKLIVWLLAVYFIIIAITFAFIQPITVYNSYLSLAGSIIITFLGIFFLFNYFNLDNHAEEKHWRPVIWITIGIVAFYPVVNISFALYKYMAAKDANVFGVPLYQVSPQVMSMFMYGCFAYAFYLCKKKN